MNGTRALFIVIGVAYSAAAWALPTGGQVVHGQASISSQGAVMQVQQASQNATINWHNFRVAPGEQVSFTAPNAQSITLNRVSGDTDIQGLVQSNANLWFSNPNGIFTVRDGGRIQAAGEVFVTGRDVAPGEYAKPSTPSTGRASLDGTVAIAARQIHLDMSSIRMAGATLTAESKVIVQAKESIEAQGATITAGEQIVIGRDDWKSGAIAKAVDVSGARLRARQVETSGEYLRADGIDLRGTGEWLLDPTSLTITSSGSTGGSLAAAAAAGGASNVNATELQNVINSGTSVTLTASGTITQSVPLSFNVTAAGSTPTLTLDNTSGSKQNVALNTITDNSSGAGSGVNFRVFSSGGTFTLAGAINIKGLLTLDNTWLNGTSGGITTDNLATRANSIGFYVNRALVGGTGVAIKYAANNGIINDAFVSQYNNRWTLLTSAPITAATGDLTISTVANASSAGMLIQSTLTANTGILKLANVANTSFTGIAVRDGTQPQQVPVGSAGSLRGRKVIIDSVLTGTAANNIGFGANTSITILSGATFGPTNPDALIVNSTVQADGGQGFSSSATITNNSAGGNLRFISNRRITQAGAITVAANTTDTPASVVFDTTSGSQKDIVIGSLTVSAGSTQPVNLLMNSRGGRISTGAVNVPGYIFLDNTFGGTTGPGGTPVSGFITTSNAATLATSLTGIDIAGTLTAGALAGSTGITLKGASSSGTAVDLRTFALNSGAGGVTIEGSGGSSATVVNGSGGITNAFGDVTISGNKATAGAALGINLTGALAQNASGGKITFTSNNQINQTGALSVVANTSGVASSITYDTSRGNRDSIITTGALNITGGSTSAIHYALRSSGAPISVGGINVPGYIDLDNTYGAASGTPTSGFITASNASTLATSAAGITLTGNLSAGSLAGSTGIRLRGISTGAGQNASGIFGNSLLTLTTLSGPIDMAGTNLGSVNAALSLTNVTMDAAGGVKLLANAVTGSANASLILGGGAITNRGGDILLESTQSTPSNPFGITVTNPFVQLANGGNVTFSANNAISQTGAMTVAPNTSGSAASIIYNTSRGNKNSTITAGALTLTGGAIASSSPIHYIQRASGAALSVGPLDLPGYIELDNTWGCAGTNCSPASGFITVDNAATLANSSTLVVGAALKGGTGVTIRYATHNGTNGGAAPFNRSTLYVNASGSLTAVTGDLLLEAISSGTTNAHAIAIEGNLTAAAGTVSAKARLGGGDAAASFWGLYQAGGTLAGQKIRVDVVNRNPLGDGVYLGSTVEILVGGNFGVGNVDAIYIDATTGTSARSGVSVAAAAVVRNLVNAGSLRFLTNGRIDQQGTLAVSANTYGVAQDIVFDTTAGDAASSINIGGLSIGAGTSTSAINLSAKAAGAQITTNALSVPGYLLLDNTNDGTVAASNATSAVGITHGALTAGALANTTGIRLRGITSGTSSNAITGSGALTSATGLDIRGAGSTTSNGAVTQTGALTNTGGAGTGVWASSTYDISLADVTNAGSNGIRIVGGFGRAAGAAALTHGTILSLGTVTTTAGNIGLSMAQSLSPYVVEGKIGITVANASLQTNVAYGLDGGAFATSPMSAYANGNFVNYRSAIQSGTVNLTLLNNYSATYGTSYDSPAALDWLRSATNTQLTVVGASLGVTAEGLRAGLQWAATIGPAGNSNRAQSATALVTGAVLDGSGAILTIGGTTRTYTITPKLITPTGVTAANKTYDGTTAATLNTGALSLPGLVFGDVVTVSPTGTFADKNAANGKTVTVVYAVSGADAGNYTFANTTTTANISKKVLSPTGITVSNKTYDGNATASATVGTIGLLSAVASANATASDGKPIQGDDVFVTPGDTWLVTGAQFTDKNVADNKTVTVSMSYQNGGTGLSGTAAGNYILVVNGYKTTANITPKALTISGITASAKTYDGSTAAVVSTAGVTSAALQAGGLVAGDVVTVSATGVFADKNAGVNKLVNLTSSYAGADRNNYTITGQATTTATISPATLTVTANNDADLFTQADSRPAYAGVTYSGFVAGESVDTAGLTGTLTISRSNASTDSAGTYSGVLVPTGLSATNYVINYVNGSYTLLPAGKLLVRVGNLTTTYGSTPTYSIVSAQYLTVSGNVLQTLTISSGAGDAFNVRDSAGGGADISLTALNPLLSTSNSLQVGSYSIGAGSFTKIGNNFDDNVTFVGALTVEPKTLTISGLSAADKVYDGTTAASINVDSAIKTGLIPGDLVTVSATGVFADRNAGSAKTVTLTSSYGGVDRNNYTIVNQATTTATITPKPLSVSGLTATNKVYDGTASATVSGTPTLAAAIAVGSGSSSDGKPFQGDRVTISGPASGQFNSANVAQASTVNISGLSLGGNEAGNYSLGNVSVAASITPRTVTATAQVAPKTYDGTTAANASLGLIGVLAPDVGLVGVTGKTTLSGKNVGTQTVVFSDLALTGSNASNYVISGALPASTQVRVNPAQLIVTGAVATRPYTGQLQTNTYQVTGLATGDTLTVTGMAAAKNVDQGAVRDVLQVTVGNPSDYVITINSGTLSITPIALTITGGSRTVTYNAATQLNTFTASGLLGTDTVTSVTGLAVGTNAGRYADTLSAAQGRGLSNYTITFVNGELTIDRAVLTVTGATTTLPYNGQLQTNTYQLSGLQGGDTATVTGVAQARNVKDGTVADAFQVTLANPANYTVNVTNGSLKLTPLTLTVTAQANGKTYDGTTAVTANLTLSGALPGEKVGVTGTTRLSGPDAGSQAATTSGLTLTGPDADNYVLAGEGVSAGLVTVAPAALQVTGATTTLSYNGQIQTNSYQVTGLQGSDSITVTGMAQARNVREGVVPDVLRVTLLNPENYVLTLVNGSLRITPLTLSVTAQANDKVYDGTTAGTATLGLVGAITGDSVSVSGTTTLSGKGAGAQSATTTGLALSGPDADNYALAADSVSAGTVNISKKPAQVTGARTEVTADGTTIFTNAPPSVTGLASGDSVIFTGLASGQTPGTYFDQLVAEGPDAGNYVFEIQPGLLIVKLAPVLYDASGLRQSVGQGAQGSGGGAIGTLSGPAGSGAGMISAGQPIRQALSTIYASGPGRSDGSSARTPALPVFKQTADVSIKQAAIVVSDDGAALSASEVAEAQTGLTAAAAVASADRGRIVRSAETVWVGSDGARVAVVVSLTEDGVLVARVPASMAETMDEKTLALLAVSSAKELLAVSLADLKGVLILPTTG